MADYTIVSVADVPDQAAEVGMDPEHFEIRFLRESLDLRNFSVTFERFGGGWQPPQGHPHRRGHRHTVQEEVYFLVSGRAQGKFDGEVVDIGPWTAVRVPPETVRSFRAAGEEDAVFVTIGAPQAGVDDVRVRPGLLDRLEKGPRPRGVPVEAERLESASCALDQARVL